MKNENTLELIERLKQYKPFRVIYDGDDFGIYKYDKDTNKYQGWCGFIPMETMIQAIKDKDFFIKLEIPKGKE